MVPGIVYSWSWTILLDELEMYQFFAILSYTMSRQSENGPNLKWVYCNYPYYYIQNYGGTKKFFRFYFLPLMEFFGGIEIIRK